MKGPLIAACVFYIFVAAAYSLKCIFFHLPTYQGTVDEKLGDAKNCSSEDDVCLLIMYIVQQRSENSLLGFQYIRQCGKSTECDLKESLTTPNYRIRYSTACCSTDSCMPKPPELVKDKDNKNGVVCPACHSAKGILCVPTRSMECTGEETHCIFYNETMFQAHILHSYGCGSKGVFIEKGKIVGFLTFFSTVAISETKPIQGLKPANFLWCHVCHEETASHCSKHRELCDPDEEVCVSERRRITDENSRRLIMQIKRRCGKPAECQFHGVIATKDKILSIKTSCCDTDVCTTPEPVWSLKRRKNNGRICPGCFPSNNTNCAPTDVIKCNGDQTYCIHFSSAIIIDKELSSEEYHGCSTAGICEHGTIKHFEMPQYQITTEIVCSGGIRIIHHLLSLTITKCAAWSLLKLS